MAETIPQVFGPVLPTVSDSSSWYNHKTMGNGGKGLICLVNALISRLTNEIALLNGEKRGKRRVRRDLREVELVTSDIRRVIREDLHWGIDNQNQLNQQLPTLLVAGGLMAHRIKHHPCSLINQLYRRPSPKESSKNRQESQRGMHILSRESPYKLPHKSREIWKENKPQKSPSLGSNPFTW